MIPPTVTILGQEFTVLKVNDSAEESLCGSMQDAERIITINTNLDTDVQDETFYHEVVHASLALTGVGMLLTDKQEEAVCQALGLSLAGLIKNNKKLPGA